MNLGLFIGRLNPPHNGHLQTIEKSLQDNDETLVLLGSPEKQDEKNPYCFTKRKELLENYFKGQKHLTILEIIDMSSDLSWVLNIYKKICENYNFLENVYFYGGDFANDSAYKAVKQYENFFFNYTLHFVENSRKKSFIVQNQEKVDISATNLRKALDEKDYDLAKKLTQEEILERLK